MPLVFLVSEFCFHMYINSYVCNLTPACSYVYTQLYIKCLPVAPKKPFEMNHVVPLAQYHGAH